MRCPPPFSSRDSKDSSLTRLSRQKEKEQLSGLNDRLASYIERVRSLETENQRMHAQLQDFEEIQRHERDETTGLYEARIEELRKQLDTVTREKMRLVTDPSVER